MTCIGSRPDANVLDSLTKDEFLRFLAVSDEDDAGISQKVGSTNPPAPNTPER